MEALWVAFSDFLAVSEFTSILRSLWVLTLILCRVRAFHTGWLFPNLKTEI